MVEVRNFKFGTNTDHPKSVTQNAKVSLNRTGRCHVTYFSNFDTDLYISRTGEATNLKFGMQKD